MSNIVTLWFDTPQEAREAFNRMSDFNDWTGSTASHGEEAIHFHRLQIRFRVRTKGGRYARGVHFDAKLRTERTAELEQQVASLQAEVKELKESRA